MLGNEKLLIEKMKNGSSDAFFIFYREYLPIVSDFAWSLVKDSDAANEIAQNVFVKVWDRRGRLGEVESFRSYLFKMTSNAVYDYFHQTYNCKSVSLESVAGGIDVADLMTDTDLSRDIDSRDLLIKVLIEIEKLPEKSRKVFLMSRMMGMKNREIADKLHVTVKAVEYHITRSLAILRKNIAKFLG